MLCYGMDHLHGALGLAVEHCHSDGEVLLSFIGLSLDPVPALSMSHRWQAPVRFDEHPRLVCMAVDNFVLAHCA